MTQQSRTLGRGLTALLSTGLARNAAAITNANPPRSLPLTAIQTGPSQPRRRVAPEPLEELAASIKAQGVLQPILVRAVHLADADAGTTRYEIVAGERRWRAATLAGLTEIPVVIRDLTDQDAVAIALIENIQREDLTPAEEARALQRLVTDFELTHQAVAEAVGRSRAAVSNLIRLLDLPKAVVDLVESGALSMGHARALLGLESDAERTRLAHVVVDRQLTVRATEALVRRTLEGAASAAPNRPTELTVVSDLVRTPQVRVQLHQKPTGSGKLIVEFSDPESRDALVKAIQRVISS